MQDLSLNHSFPDTLTVDGRDFCGRRILDGFELNPEKHTLADTLILHQGSELDFVVLPAPLPKFDNAFGANLYELSGTDRMAVVDAVPALSQLARQPNYQADAAGTILADIALIEQTFNTQPATENSHPGFVLTNCNVNTTQPWHDDQHFLNTAGAQTGLVRVYSETNMEITTRDNARLLDQKSRTGAHNYELINPDLTYSPPAGAYVLMTDKTVHHRPDYAEHGHRPVISAPILGLK